MNVSLLDGWFPWAVQAAAAMVCLAAIGWRDRTWRLRRAPLVIVISAVATAALAVIVVRTAGITDPLPFALWIWAGVAITALVVLVAGWRGARWWHRLLAPFAALLALLAGANALNLSTGYYPTVDDAIGELTDSPLPQQITLDQLGTVTGKTKTGRIVSVNIPPTSGFQPRQELVYLPPAWFRSKSRPKLPVLEMIGGEFSEPDNWVRAGNAVAASDAYAQKHHGFSPVLVFTDAAGGFKVDTECVDGPHGMSEDHLVKDIPPYIEKTFGTSTSPRKWGVVGWSMGGTCAVGLTVEHPDVFTHFEDISGDIGPNTGNKQQTINKLYGGNAAAWDAHDPLTVLAHHGKYQHVTGWFESGDQESRHIMQAKQLRAAAHRDGINSTVTVAPGKHDWQFGSTAFAQALPWLAQQLGTPGAKPGATTHTPKLPVAARP
ncbi:alpha/beta hydrolase [Streptantibioticus ferralitis]|uniref:Alpha/beta hydrolase-fold protein n=1 Tax=Streptantibioticus ferralitis TaxID=236510 RepID=A0ABT5Z7Y4_9ACTN|nr:alpha/beta hydrolase-fold protein [Streptantibioticus ferralitis]MDF2259945.1 alpha/beta hydrolase-fold protein [Streptantibioticus ferralitis]